MQPDESREPDRPLGVVDAWLDRADQLVYAIVVILFLIAAAAMAVYSVVVFLQRVNQDFPTQLIAFINDLLLVLIIMEVTGTVRSYLTTGATSLRPFLYIGIISATRRILAIGAQSALGELSGTVQFQERMIDLGVNAAVVLALAAALFLFGRPGATQTDPQQDA